MNTDNLTDAQRKILVAHEKMHAEFAALCEAKEAFYEWEERKSMWVDSPERKALEIAHIMFGVEVELFSKHENKWQSRKFENEKKPFNKYIEYRRKK